MPTRRPNTNRNGGNWTPQEISANWNKAIPIVGVDPSYKRLDKCKHIIEFTRHGDRNSDLGWEIDHINPVANGGDDSDSNLQPLCWKCNLNKGDSLNWKCSYT